MVTSTQQTTQSSSTIVEEELKRVSASQLYAAINNSSATLMTLGIMQMVFGAAAVALPAFAGALFVVLLGGAVLISGGLNVVSAVVQNHAQRLILGAVELIAGLLIIAHPLFGLAFLTALAGVYLIAAGIARFFEPKAASASMASAIVTLILGIIVLASLPAASDVLIGLFVGVNLLIGGYLTAQIASKMKSALS